MQGAGVSKGEVCLCQLLVWQFQVIVAGGSRSVHADSQKSREIFAHSGGFMSWINTLIKFSLRTSQYNNLLSPSASVAVIMEPCSGLDKWKKKELMEKRAVNRKRDSQCHHHPKAAVSWCAGSLHRKIFL